VATEARGRPLLGSQNAVTQDRSGSLLPIRAAWKQSPASQTSLRVAYDS